MHTIKKAAELTGVSEHTLRAWERRYELFGPTRAASGYRQYSSGDVELVVAMKGLVNAGWAPRRAAAEIARRHSSGNLTDPYEGLLAAAAALDAAGVSTELDAQLANAPFETVVDQWLLPALDRLGSAWADGRVSVASEHLVANQVMRRLAAAYDRAVPPEPERPVLIGAPPGVDHQLGIFAFAVACRRAGLPTLFLGAQVPIDAWRDAAKRSRPRAAVTAVPRRGDVAKAAAVVAELSSLQVPTWLGGRYQHLVSGPAILLGHSVSAGAARLAATVGDTRTSDDQPTSSERPSVIASVSSAGAVSGSAVTGTAPGIATGADKSMVRTVRGANGADT